MFTGIVEERAEIASLEGGRMTVRSRLAEHLSPGDSIAVNGVCLTVTDRGPADLAFDLSSETLVRTTLGSRSAGDPVNLERPATLTSPLGGHLVQGHVDDVAHVTALAPEATGGARLSVRLPQPLRRFVVEKGSITLDGVSLTVAAIEGDVIDVALIPHTLRATTFGTIGVGEAVNVEVDVIARYVVESVTGTGHGVGRPDAAPAAADPPERRPNHQEERSA